MYPEEVYLGECIYRRVCVPRRMHVLRKAHYPEECMYRRVRIPGRVYTQEGGCTWGMCVPRSVCVPMRAPVPRRVCLFSRDSVYPGDICPLLNPSVHPTRLSVQQTVKLMSQVRVLVVPARPAEVLHAQSTFLAPLCAAGPGHFHQPRAQETPGPEVVCALLAPLHTKAWTMHIHSTS